MKKKNKKKIIPFVAVIVIGGLLLAYGYRQSHALLVGPTLSVNTPASGSVFEEPLVAITGSAERAAHLTLNGSELVTTPEGTFEEHIVLSPGSTHISLKATDKFGKVTQQDLTLFLEQPADNIAKIEQPETELADITNNI